MHKFYWLDKIKSSDWKTVGERAFYLAHLMEQGYPIVSGFVIPANSFWQFLQCIDWSDPLLLEFPNYALHFNVNNYQQLQQISQSINYNIASTDLPSDLFLSLESAIKNLNAEVLIFQLVLASPRLKTLGILEPIICQAIPKEFVPGIKQAWAEIFNAKSLLYWHSQQVEIPQLQPVVIVQPVQSAIASGNIKAFTNSWEIQATHGLGVSIELGQVIPDSYIISAENCTVENKKLGNKTIVYNPDARIVKVSDTDTWQGNYHTQIPFPKTLAALQIFLLPEKIQKEFVLEEKQLQSLIQLTQGIVNSIGTNFGVKWSFSQRSNDAKIELLITDFERFPQEDKILAKLPQSAKEEKSISIPNTEHPIVKGIVASSGKVTAKAIVIKNIPPEVEEFPDRAILVVPVIIPSYLPLLKKVSGIISEQGGITSHAAILAREIGIPAIVGATNSTNIIKTGDHILIDGNNGAIYLAKEDNYDPHKLEMPVVENSLKNQNLPPIGTKLFVNLSQINSIKKVPDSQIDGVGLLRSELMAIELLENHHPLWWIQQGRQSELVVLMVKKLSQFAAAFTPKPVFYRSLDLALFNSSDREKIFTKIPEEFITNYSGNQDNQTEANLHNHRTNYSNPILGRHGTFSYMLEPSLLDLEIDILSQVYELGYTNVHLILPFVRSVEEFQFCQNRIQTKWENRPNHFQIWIMAEIPSVLFLLPEYVKAGVRGIAIGTNDLTQLLLGVDREEEQMASAFDTRQPAVMRAIQQLISQAKTSGIPCSICGDAPALYPEIIDNLIRWGITSISVNVDAVDKTYNSIARAEQRLILEAAQINNLGSRF
ncbi:MAG: phosphoenolpyruvate synthase [Okeania sp. SIO2G4]|uniref:putative PEP-binding protein n=1 Tax=unclassified Okeania TaxID=2634635 RepID=UPI0013B82E58|nr:MULTISPECIES: putative PEP-binding protein [unclassified Okeania]NEP39507.1 phosphoenolpyruvate synthase [Okeania sp. SIO2H7]NEP73403.1 phosphoenolpyruvate synthase [Okeania sp. SIO2G5]NEP94936.1 phosphoenolpyruvate synthase [Okeania sp. SIO2F5]NEQ92042.1 phosphoenolpyruvate synthase [Okeania sp. SIO2G4]